MSDHSFRPGDWITLKDSFIDPNLLKYVGPRKKEEHNNFNDEYDVIIEYSDGSKGVRKRSKYRLATPEEVAAMVTRRITQ